MQTRRRVSGSIFAALTLSACVSQDPADDPEAQPVTSQPSSSVDTQTVPALDSTTAEDTGDATDSAVDGAETTTQATGSASTTGPAGGTLPDDALPGIGAALKLFGATSIEMAIPDNEAHSLLSINTESTQFQLEVLNLLEDGAAGASVACRVHEVGSGAYELSVSYQGDDGLAQLQASAVTANGVSADGYLTLKSPFTGGESYAGGHCAVALGYVQAGGGAALAEFTCSTESGLLNNANNCEPPPVACDKTLEGVVTFFLKNCDK